jgi:hypothetical protein
VPFFSTLFESNDSAFSESGSKASYSTDSDYSTLDASDASSAVQEKSRSKEKAVVFVKTLEQYESSALLLPCLKEENARTRLWGRTLGYLSFLSLSPTPAIPFEPLFKLPSKRDRGTDSLNAKRRPRPIGLHTSRLNA